MKYKVRDKVRIKPKEALKHNVGTVGDMLSYSNKEATILSVLKDGESEEFGYRIDVDNGFWVWRDADFEGLVSVEKPIISTDLIKDIAEVIKTHNLGISISENDGKLIIEPLEVEEEVDLPIDTPCLVSDDAEDWALRYYCGNNQCFSDGLKSYNSKYKDGDEWLYIIEFSKFNVNDIKQSLKYNIVKK